MVKEIVISIRLTKNEEEQLENIYENTTFKTRHAFHRQIIKEYIDENY